MTADSQHIPHKAEPSGPGRLLRFLSRPWMWVVVLILGAVYIVLDQPLDWLGRKDIDLKFVVVDSETRERVGDATIAVVGGSFNTPPVTARTARDGTAGVMVRCKSIGRDTLLRHTGSVYLGDRGFRVSKEGYISTELLRVWDYTGPVRQLNDLTLPTIRIELKKEPGKN